MSDEEKKREENEELADTTEKMPEAGEENQEPGDWEHFDWTEGFCSWDLNAAEITEELPPPSESIPQPIPEAEAAVSAKKKKRRIWSLPESVLAAMLYVAGVLVMSFFLATVGWHWANDLLALDKTEKVASITISENQTISEVADNLKENGLIEYKFLFKIFAAVTGKASQITTGTYELNTEMDYSALLNNISSTSVYRETVTVTIPEGYTVMEAFQLLEDSGVCTVEKLTASAEQDSFDYSFLEDVDRTGVAKLEGYLFPDTYEFYKGADAKSVINKLLSNFTDRFDSEMDAEMQILGYSKDEIIIIASIIEKETTGDDRNDIASVIYNRLSDPDHDGINGYLQMDSTVQYLMEERKEHLTNEDIAVDSLYNTYRYPGLPAGPICNPGLTSIKAALQPNKTDYYYFMLGDDGEDHFFADSGSFNAFKAAQTGEPAESEDDTVNE